MARHTFAVFFILSIVKEFYFVQSAETTEESAPHIIFILADDLGWNDVSFHGSPQIPTPNLDALAASGIILQNFYAHPQCSSSRGSLMTGRYASNIGLQHDDITCGQPYGLPTDIKIMPEYFQDLGYATHILGKWQLGYANKSYLPTSRGFENFFGCVNGQLDYYDYTLLSRDENNIYWGIDLYDGEEIMKDFRGQYVTDLLTDRAIYIINQHNKSKPLFLFMSHIATHLGNSYTPLQAPPEYVAKYSHIGDLFRRIYAGMVSKLDESVGRIFKSLDENDLLDNSIIIFASDNGAVAISDTFGSFSSNWPLKGGKKTLWEGGLRVPALIWSPLLKLQEPRTSTQMIHMVDWLPTLYEAAGGELKELGKVDGMSAWGILKENKPSLRGEILFHIDKNYSMGAIRIGDYKLVKGSHPEGYDGWYGTSGTEDVSLNSTLDEWVWRDGSIIKDILEKSNRWLAKSPDSWRQNVTVNCGKNGPSGNGGCDPGTAPCLFNIVRDPCEYVNLAPIYPKIVRLMQARLKLYEDAAMQPLNAPIDPRSNPRCHTFAYVPWLDEDFPSECQ